MQRYPWFSRRYLDDCAKRSYWNRIPPVAIMLTTGRYQTPPPMWSGAMRLMQQIIIKFKPHTIACDATQIAHLSAVTRVPLQYVRPLIRRCVRDQAACE